MLGDADGAPVAPSRRKLPYLIEWTLTPLGKGREPNGHCHAAGELVDPCRTIGTGSCLHTCTEADVVTEAKRAVVGELTGWVQRSVPRCC